MHTVKVKSIKKITPDVLQIVCDRPDPYAFSPGQATEVSINKTGWMKEKRPFTFTSLPADKDLEFTIKTYPAHKGVTDQLLHLQKDDELILHEVFGTITYKGEGVFIAGGAGVTPFISIFRFLQANNQIGHNKLIFANKTKADIILEGELKEILGSNFINILSEEKIEGYGYGMITEDFIKTYRSDIIDQYFYLCGPPPMIKAIGEQLIRLEVDEKYLVKEEF